MRHARRQRSSRRRLPDRQKQGDRTILGIYEIKGDTLKLCYYTINNGRRPVEFSQKGSDKIGFIALTRAKK